MESTGSALQAFEERMSKRADDQAHESPPPVVQDEPKRLECPYQLPIVYKCTSEKCGGKMVALSSPDIVQAGLRGLQINLNCPGCREPVALIPPAKPLVVPVAVGNREARRKAMHIEKLAK